MKEEPLKGGMSARQVVKIENRVHRSKSSNHVFVHQVLRHLEQFDFSYAPRFLDVDNKEREILTFIEGEVPRAFELDFEQIKQAVEVLRKLHDVLAKSALKGKKQTICHNDFAPWNIIIKNNQVVGIIDFDECAPGNRMDDLAYFIWTFLDLGTSNDADGLQIDKIDKLIHAYGSGIQKADLVPAILEQQYRILKFRQQIIKEEKDAALVDFSKSAVQRIQKSMVWLRFNRKKIEETILKIKNGNE